MEAPRNAGGIGRAIVRRCRVLLVILAAVGAVLLDAWANNEQRQHQQRHQVVEVAR